MKNSTKILVSITALLLAFIFASNALAAVDLS
jgi:hypothetical protein